MTNLGYVRTLEEWSRRSSKIPLGPIQPSTGEDVFTEGTMNVISTARDRVSLDVTTWEATKQWYTVHILLKNKTNKQQIKIGMALYRYIHVNSYLSTHFMGVNHHI